jgi:hypothetical protein
LPLTATDCDAGTALLTSELSLLGASSPVGTAGTPSGLPASDPCPSGDAALAALGAALANVPAVQTGAFVFKQPGPTGAPSFVLINPGPIQAPGLFFSYGLDASSTPIGVWVEKQPGPAGLPQLLVLTGSGTPGVAVLKAPGPPG